MGFPRSNHPSPSADGEPAAVWPHHPLVVKVVGVTTRGRFNAPDGQTFADIHGPSVTFEPKDAVTEGSIKVMRTRRWKRRHSEGNVHSMRWNDPMRGVPRVNGVVVVVAAEKLNIGVEVAEVAEDTNPVGT